MRYIQNEKSLDLLIEAGQYLKGNQHADLVLYENYDSSSDCKKLEEISLEEIDTFLGRTKHGYGINSPRLEDMSDFEYSIEDKRLTVHTITDKLLEECEKEGRYLILNHEYNTYIDYTAPHFRAIRETLRFKSYDLEPVLKGTHPSELEIIPIASDVNYTVDLEGTYPDDPRCGIYSIHVTYTTPTVAI